MKILKQLKSLRQERSLSQRDLAAISGVAYESIGQLERSERKARPSTVRKLADALGVEPAFLSTESESPEDMFSRWHREHDERMERTDSLTYFSRSYDRRQESTRHFLGKVLKEKSLAELAELAESADSPDVRGAIRSELAQRPRRRDEFYRDPEWNEWVDANRGNMEWYVAGREPNRKYSIGANGATMNGDLAIARAKLNSGLAGELEESAQLAARAIQKLSAYMDAALERELREYEALPSHYFEDPSAARRIGEIGASMAASQRQDLKMLREFISIGDQARLKLSTDIPLKAGEAEALVNLTDMQKNVLLTVLECGEPSFSTVADKLTIHPSTAHGSLSVLADHNLVTQLETSEMYVITPLGRDVANAISKTRVEQEWRYY